MAINTRDDVISANFNEAQLEKRCLKGWRVLRSSDLYVPVYRVAMEIQITRFRRRQRQHGTWLIDTLQPHLCTASERVTLTTRDIRDAITLTPGLSRHDAPEVAHRALLAQRFRFLTRPDVVKGAYLDTIYHPFTMVLVERKDRHRLMVLDQVTGEENLFLKACMQLPERVR